jgi:outer membrane receptor for monomeric catechols
MKQHRPQTPARADSARTERNLSYTSGRYTRQLNLKNLTNERYFVGSYNDLYVNPGSTRSAMLNFSVKY